MKDSSISVITNTVSNFEKEETLLNSFTFQSKITKLEKPIGKHCPVYILNKLSGEIVYKTETDETSSIYVPNLKKYIKYLVIATDIQDIYNSVVFDLNWDTTASFGINYNLNYYKVSDLDNIQALLDFTRVSDNKKTDPNIVSHISKPFSSSLDDMGIQWSSSGTSLRQDIGTVPGYKYNGSFYLYTSVGVFYKKVPLTFEAYFQTTTNNVIQNIFSQNAGAGKTISLSLDTSLNLKFIREATEGTTELRMSSLAPLQIDKKYHVALCFDGANFYLFLNGILQTTVADSFGIPYQNSPFYIGNSFNGIIAGTSISQACKYTSNFDILFTGFSYNPLVYNNPSDLLAQYVVLKLQTNKLSDQAMIQDVAKNTRFKMNSSSKDPDYLISSTINPTITAYPTLPLGTKDFCIELSFKLLNNPTNSVLISNQDVDTTLRDQEWALYTSTTAPLNKYKLMTQAQGSWATQQSSRANEQTTLSVTRENTKLRFFINGFLDSEHTILSTVNFDNRYSSFLSFGRNFLVNFYDIKVTLGQARYTTEYTPTLIDIVNKDILDKQYLNVSYTFKKTYMSSVNSLITSVTDILLDNTVSINGTTSAYFNGTTTNILFSDWYTVKEMFTVECFLKPVSKLTTQTLYSCYDTLKEYFKISIKDNILSYYNGVEWTPTTYTVDYDKLNHIVIQRVGNVFKVLADGSLVLETSFVTLPNTVLNFAVGVDKTKTEYLEGYINNLFCYKNYNKFENVYTVPVEEIVSGGNVDVEPVVVVNENTTSALDFEKGLIDKIPTTIWKKEGSADLTTNKIFGNNSFQTKALGDALSTDSSIITGGSTPFTIEFYALIQDLYYGSAASGIWQPFLSKNKNVSAGSQVFGIINKNVYFDRGSGVGSSLEYTDQDSVKINNNELNKYTLSYDGCAIRIFVNEYLEYVVGTSVGMVVTTEPYRFFYNLVPGYVNNRVSTKGIIDNINIHDGVATKVRDPDPYEEFLIVDLAFDGENNSTKIINNGTNKSIWELTTYSTGATRYPYCKLLANNKYQSGGFSYLNKPSVNSDYVRTLSDDLNFNNNDFTIEFEFIKTDDSVLYTAIASTYCVNYSELTSNKSLFNLSCMGAQYTVQHVRNRVFFFNEYEMTRTDTPSLNTTTTFEQVYKIDNSVISTTVIQINVPYKVTILRKENELKLYINGILECTNRATREFNLCGVYGFAILGNAFIDSTSLVGSMNYFKVYNGVAVIPESPVGKIQLDFDNNVTDKYNNSTWINNGVTFDQVNSVKGYSAYFNYNNSKLTLNSENLNFTNNNALLSFDCKINNKNTSIGWDTLITSGGADAYDRCAIAFNTSGNLRLRVSSDIVSDVSVAYVTNAYYNIALNKTNNTSVLKLNDCIVSSVNSNTLNFNASNLCTIGGALYNASEGFNGYLDNFKAEKDYQGEVIIDKPAVHLPLETNAINTGFTHLTINSVGNPTYTTIDGKKCIKFESGKYLTINSNNIFNLGTISDFYIEFDFNLIDFSGGHNVLFGTGSPSSDEIWIWITQDGSVRFRHKINGVDGNLEISGVKVTKGNWYNLILRRKNNTLEFLVSNSNGETFIETSSVSYNLKLDNNTTIGFTTAGVNSQQTANSYMSNFKMFVGTSTIPETYNDKKVLDLNFKPTRESYLFRDSNNKCVIHPVNIYQRDYLDGKYACTFNGTNQYIELGKNELFNFGYDDFIMEFKFRVVADNTWNILLGNGSTSSDNTYCYLGISPSEQPINKSLVYIACENVALPTNNEVSYTDINHLIISRKGTIVTIVLNSSVTIHDRPQLLADFNSGGMTRIGTTNRDNYIEHLFNGSIYSVKIFRNTSDLSLLEETKVKKPLDDYIVARLEPLLYSGTGAHVDQYGVTWAGNATRSVIGGLDCFNFTYNSYIKSSDPNVFSFGFDDFSIKCSVYQTSSSGYVSLFASGSVDTLNLEAVATNPSLLSYYFHKASSTGRVIVKSSYTTNPPIQSNVWIDVILTRNGSTLTLKVGSNLIQYDIQSGSSFNFGYDSFYIGQTPYPYTGFIGYIRDFIVYKGVDILTL